MFLARSEDPATGLAGNVRNAFVEELLEKLGRSGCSLISYSPGDSPALPKGVDDAWFLATSPATAEAARKARIKSIRIESRYGGSEEGLVDADFCAPSPGAAADFICRGYRRLNRTCMELAAGVGPGGNVVIGGLSRSGKSTLAAALALAMRARGLRVKILSLDSFLLDVRRRSGGVLGRFDVAKIEEVLVALSQRRPEVAIPVPRYDKLTQRSFDSGDSISLRPDDVLIVEGIIALEVVAPRRATCRVHVVIDEGERKARVLREYLLRGKTETESQAIYASRQLDEAPVVQRASAGAMRLDVSELLR